MVVHSPRGGAAISQEENSDWDLNARQGSTIVPVNLSGGVPQFKGNIILAERCQVESGPWWQRHPDIGLIVQCTSGSRRFRYPKASHKCRIVRVDARDPERRQAMLDKHFAAISQRLETPDVLILCEQPYHGALVAVAAIHQRLTGTSAQAHYHFG